MADRSRFRVGKTVGYIPTAAEASGIAGDIWPATVGVVNRDGTASLSITKGNGVMLAKTSVPRGNTAGTYDQLRGL